MKLAVVVRSVAVMVAAPILALPLGAEEERSDAHVTEAARSPVSAARSRSAPAGPRAAGIAMAEKRSVGPVPREATEPEQVKVSVQCAHDGCVVQDGLAVVVLGPQRY